MLGNGESRGGAVRGLRLGLGVRGVRIGGGDGVGDEIVESESFTEGLDVSVESFLISAWVGWDR